MIETLEKSGDVISKFLICALIISVTFFIKLAIPIGGGSQVFFTLICIYLLIGLGFLSGRLEIRKQNFGAYLLLVGGLLTTQILGNTDFSLLSITMLVIVHLPYIFRIKEGTLPYFMEIVFFQRIMAILAVLGIFQFFIQFLTGPDYAFPIDSFLPQNLIMQGYHGTNPLNAGKDIYKSTGFVSQEPSNFSQLLALAVIIEMIYFLNWKRIVLYLIAIALTFSGTGLILLFALTPFYLLLKRHFIILISLMVLLVSAPVWAPLIGLGGTVERAGEFSNQNSSGYARFISPFRSVNERVLSGDPQTILWGLGAGAMSRTMSKGVDYETAGSTWGKIIYEYGIIGGLVYFSFMGYMFFADRKSVYLILALFIQFYFLGEHVFPPTIHGLIFALLIWPRHNKPTTNDVSHLASKGIFPRLMPAVATTHRIHKC